MARSTGWSKTAAIGIAVLLIATACGSSEEGPATAPPAATPPPTADSATTEEATTDASGDGSSTGATPTTTADGTSSEEATADGSDDTSATAESEPEFKSTIVFTSTNGSALFGTRTVFELTDSDSGDTILVPVEGDGENTTAVADVPPGRYLIASAGPSLTDSAASIVDLIEPAEVTLAAPTADAPEQSVTVEFSLATVLIPLDLRVEGITATSVTMSWATRYEGLDPTYVLRGTQGMIPADGASAGFDVQLTSPTATTAIVEGLDPETEYTFALFATASTGDPIPFASVAATTADLARTVAYALAPNTIVPTDFAALNAERIDDSRIQISLSAANAAVASSGEAAAPCAVGMPILVSTEIAGQDAFYGLIDSCGSTPASFRQTGETTAIVNIDVPLSAVFDYYEVNISHLGTCYDLETGVENGPDSAACASSDSQSGDSDGDGLADDVEALVGTNPDLADSDGDEIGDYEEIYELGTDPLNVDSDGDTLFDDEAVVWGTDPLNADSDGDGCWDPGELQSDRDPTNPSDADTACPVPPGYATWQQLIDENHSIGVGVGAQEVEVTLLWSSGDDLDLSVVDPTGERVSWRSPRSPSDGIKERDETIGDCAATTLRAEIVRWADAPAGEYSVDLEQYGSPCSSQVTGQLEVRVGGVLISDETINVTTPSQRTIGTFTVDPALGDGWRQGGGSAGTYEVPLPNTGIASSRYQQPIMAGQGPVLECDNDGPSPELALNPTLDLIWTGRGQQVPERWDSGFVNIFGSRIKVGEPRLIPAYTYYPDATLKLYNDGDSKTVAWDLRAGVKVTAKPEISFSVVVECTLELVEIPIDIQAGPVPISIKITPKITGGAEAAFSLTGPTLTLELGIESSGSVKVTPQYCLQEGMRLIREEVRRSRDWSFASSLVEWVTEVVERFEKGFFRVPCGFLKPVTEHKTAPFLDFTKEDDVTVTGTASISAGLGADVSVGLGRSSWVATARAGVSVGLEPIVATISATADSTGALCVGMELGAAFDVSLIAEGFVGLKSLGGEVNVPIFEKDIPYPNAEWDLIGKCPE